MNTENMKGIFCSLLREGLVVGFLVAFEEVTEFITGAHLHVPQVNLVLVEEISAHVIGAHARVVVDALN